MILPIYLYGQPVLRKTAVEVDLNDATLKTFVADLYETMYNADGVGLAAPQVGKSVRVFVVDSTPYKEIYPDHVPFKGAFINPTITDRFGQDVPFAEGCLSLPKINEEVIRKSDIHITYYDENGEFHDCDINGVLARIIQHEYDHLEGKVFTDNLSQIKKMVLKRPLNDIAGGKVHPAYKTMKR
ncbi:MAG: peptide deformylase [Bacteroidales bacterium]|nr:peptide deformylase [Bacteroidales bacterium]